MSIGFQHPSVSTHVGDGFKFLADRKNEFDVIITDSSDPEGPAESLFQKPYFELLFGALREGGVITTQGCSFFPSHLSYRSPLFLCFFHTYLSPHTIAGANQTLTPSREPMASPANDNGAQEILQRSLPNRRIRLHYHPNLPIRPNRFHGLLQGCQQRREDAIA